MPKKNPNPTKLEIVRRAAGLTRQELAKKCGLNYRTIEAYEQRKNDINMAAVISVKKISSALGVTMDEIVD